MERVARSELGAFVKKVLEKLPAADGFATTIALRGNLGSGKTTFVQELAKELGITDLVQSPTYVLMKSYPISYKHFNRLVHIDAYRLENAEEFKTLKPQSLFNDGHALICVEWPERVGKALPTADIVINFSSDPPAGEASGASEEERYIEVL
jgi:tRNA threonylcarbamoyladenosine biosynthesis protein TsaE